MSAHRIELAAERVADCTVRAYLVDGRIVFGRGEHWASITIEDADAVARLLSESVRAALLAGARTTAEPR